ncbi:MAG: hypothetical protein Kow00114_35070 [Kiloniellaceae bacterium]
MSAAPALALDAEELKEMEGLLRELGFDPGPVDGVVDADTTEAIRQYKEFALAPGAPEPSAALLGELRGVAAAFAALNADKAKAAEPEPVPAPLPDLGAGPEPEPAPEPVAEKVIVPPPPAPPKLKPVEAVPEQLAELPPATAAPEAEPEPVDETQAMLDEELAPFQNDLDSGAVTRAELAKTFNAEGRRLLQAAQYDQAIRKFSVSIFLDPDFAGAYSNRGTAWQRKEQPDLAKADFDKARELGFGGFRVKDGSNPLN